MAKKHSNNSHRLRQSTWIRSYMNDQPKQPRRRRLRIRLRTLLILVAGICTCLAWYGHRVESQKKAVAWVKANGGIVHYDHEFNLNGEIQFERRN